MKKIYLVILTVILTTVTQAQPVNLAWAKSMGGIGYDYARAMTSDISGNLYITGPFFGTVDFDPNAGIFNLTSNGDQDIFIQKLDANGNFLWAKSIGGTGDDDGTSITTDANGDVYITGFYSGTVDFDPNTATFNLTSNGTSDGFIQKLDGNGNFLWAKSEVSGAITTDANGNVYLTGSYQGTVDFDPNAGTFSLTSNGSSDIFIQKLDANGNFIWAKSMGGTLGGESGSSITTDANGNVYLTGSYQGTVDFDPNAGTFNLTSNGNQDIFIQKLDANGNFLWAKSMGSPLGYEYGFSITTSPSGNIYVTGSYQGTVDFDPNAGIFNLTSNGGQDVYILKLDANGNFLWAKSMGALETDVSNCVTTDSFGNVYITGFFDGTVDFDPGSAIFNLTTNNQSDIFIQKLDAGGNFVWAISVGGAGEDFSESITIDASNGVYIAGYFGYTVDFDPTASTFNLTADNYGDAFILKLNQLSVNIEETILLNDVSIFPNPSQGIVNINLGDLKSPTVKVFSLTGQLIYQKENINASVYQFELNEAPGVYFVEVSSQNEKLQYKLVKK